MARRPRFIAPHFVEVEGGADLPGPVLRACAFTTAAPGWPCDAEGASHRHDCLLTSASGQGVQERPVHWRTETQALSGAPERTRPRVAEGVAGNLMLAIAAALGAAHAGQPLAPGVSAPSGTAASIAPGFVAMRQEPGLPGIWVCSQLSALGPVSATRPWTHLQTAHVRERRDGYRRRYLCSLEVLPYAAVMPGLPEEFAHLAAHRPAMVQWTAPSLAVAMQACLIRMFTPRLSGLGENLDLGGPAERF